MGGGGERVCKEKKMQSNGSQVVVVEGRGVVRKNKFRARTRARDKMLFFYFIHGGVGTASRNRSCVAQYIIIKARGRKGKAHRYCSREDDLPDCSRPRIFFWQQPTDLARLIFPTTDTPQLFVETSRCGQEVGKPFGQVGQGGQWKQRVCSGELM